MKKTESARLRLSVPGDEAGACSVCLKTGDEGGDGERFYREDPDALGRIYVLPYLRFEPDLSLMLEDAEGICGYTLAAFDSCRFFERYEKEMRPGWCRRFPEPVGDATAWSRVQQIHYQYHHPDYFCPQPYEEYPSHLHIDLLPRVQGGGYGRRMIEDLLERLRAKGSPGVHLGLGGSNTRAYGFYRHMGFEELTRTGEGDDEVIYMGQRLEKDGAGNE